MSNKSLAKFDTVMIIDDNIIDLYIGSRMITRNNFGTNVIPFSKAQDALDFLRDNEYDNSKLPQIIFIDIYMPSMSGFEFLTEFDHFSSSLKQHSKVYILSSTIDDYDIVRARSDENIASFQVKPITKEFLDKINKF